MGNSTSKKEKKEKTKKDKKQKAADKSDDTAANDKAVSTSSQGLVNDVTHRFGPLIAFTNAKSGGNQAVEVHAQLKKLLGEDFVFDLAEGGPLKALQKYENKIFRILVCGGDGSAGWVLSTLDKLQFNPLPPLAILPLGTGNDLSRSFEWGPGYTGQPLQPIIESIASASLARLDRWNVQCQPLKMDEIKSDQHKQAYKVFLDEQESEGFKVDHSKQQTFIMNNYFSIGGDAEIALDFHEMREKHRGLFFNRLVNKGWYGAFSIKSMLARKEQLSNSLTLEIDGKEVELPSNLEAVLFLNLPSWAGGADPWGTFSDNADKTQRQQLDDQKFEVVGFSGAFHMGQIQTGLAQGVRLGQASKVIMTTQTCFPAQVDGEPWMMIPCRTEISLRNQSNMLFNDSDKERQYKKEVLFANPQLTELLPLDQHNNLALSLEQQEDESDNVEQAAATDTNK